MLHLGEALYRRQATVLCQGQGDALQCVCKSLHGVLVHTSNPLSFCFDGQAAGNLSRTSAIDNAAISDLQSTWWRMLNTSSATRVEIFESAQDYISKVRWVG